jgi:hypothetical protein
MVTCAFDFLAELGLFFFGREDQEIQVVIFFNNKKSFVSGGDCFLFFFKALICKLHILLFFYLAI